MADNVVLNSGSGGALIATDDIAGVQHQYIKVEYGDDGVATPVSISYPLPTTFSGLSIGVTGIPFVTGNINVFSMPSNVIVSGNVTGINNTVSIALPNGCSTIGLQVSNSWIGQLEFEGSVDNTNYNTIYSSNGINTINATAGNGIFILPGAGYVSTRVRASTWTSGTGNVTFVASIGDSASILTGPLPGGTNNIGDVDIASIAAGSTIGITGTPTIIASYPVGVTGTFWPASQTVTGTVNIATTNVGLTGTPTVNISSITAGVTVGVTGQKVGITGTLTDNISYITPGVTIGVTGANIGITGQPTVYVSYPVGVTGTFWQSTQAVTGTVNINTTSVGITGIQTVLVSYPAGVTGTFWQNIQHVTGTVNIGTIAAGTSVGISGAVWVTGIAVSIADVGITGTPTVWASYPVGVTGTFWQTIQTITGTVNIATTQVGITGIQTVLTSYPVGITGNVGLTGIPPVSISNIVAGTNLIGDVGIAPRTTGGLSYISIISSGGGVNLTEVKASIGQLYGVYSVNTNAAIRYLKIYDALTGVVTVGTTTPQLRLPVPGNAAGAGFYVDWVQGIVFNTGITFALTTGVSDTDTGAVAANELVINAFYK